VNLRSDRWLRYRADYRSLLFVVLTLALLLVPVFVRLPVAVWPAWILLTSLRCFSVCAINHNHVHIPVFTSRTLNAILGIVLTFARGHTSAGVIVSHNFNHHRHNGSVHDWIRPTLAGQGYGLLRLSRFIARTVVEMAKGRNSAGAPQLSGRWQRQLQRERIWFACFILPLLVLDARNVVLFMVVPWIVSLLLLLGVNLLQHDACDPSSEIDHSRNFTSRLGNWFYFNNGYHTAHHLFPSMHWSLLPAVHESEIKRRLRSPLEERSLLGYLWRRYLTPESR
jgi:fatty acid desaturase